jgi:ABC-type multidrug transport system fused ATPase/permease subunit
MVVDKGTIAEEGTYDELIAKNGIFAELVRRQRLE